MQNDFITISSLEECVKPYFIENTNIADQSSIKTQLAEMKDLCSKLIQKLYKVKPESIESQMQYPSHSSHIFKWVYLKQKKLAAEYNIIKKELANQRIELYNALIRECDRILKSNCQIQVIPLVALIQNCSFDDFVKKETFELTNRVFLLQNYLISKSFFLIPNVITKDMTKTIKFLSSQSDEKSKWFPRCNASERIQAFLGSYMKFDISKVPKFLPSIFTNAQHLIKQCNLSNDYFPTAYLLCYRTAFDLVYPQFFINGITPDFQFTKKPVQSFESENIKKMIEEGAKMLQNILFETNPIDIGYYISVLLNTVVTNIIYTDKYEKGKQGPFFISAEECINVVQYLLYHEQFTYAVHLLPILDRFCSDEGYPTSFKYGCENFRIATIDLFE